MDPLSQLNERLSAWHGTRAELWDYTVSHSILRLHLSRSPNGPSALLGMYACKRVSFSSGWERATVSVSQLSDDPIKYLVTDGANLRVECGNVHLSAPLASYAEIPRSALDPPPEYKGAG